MYFINLINQLNQLANIESHTPQYGKLITKISGKKLLPPILFLTRIYRTQPFFFWKIFAATCPADAT